MCHLATSPSVLVWSLLGDGAGVHFARLAAAEKFSTFFLFATHLAVGLAVVLPFVPLARVGRRFFVLMSFVAIVFLALALAARGLETSYFYLGFAGCLVFYNVFLPRQSQIDVSEQRQAREGGPAIWTNRCAQALLLAAAVCGLIALVEDAKALPTAPSVGAASFPIAAATFVTSALLLGSTLVSMTLGHWYLVLRNLSFGPLARLTLVMSVALCLRIIVAGVAFVLQRHHWEELLRVGWMAFLVDPGIFVVARLLFGFLVPSALCWMTWRCVQIRSNQSATGILYVCLAFVLIGEIISKYFLVSAGFLI